MSTTWTQIGTGTQALVSIPFDNGSVDGDQYPSLNAAIAAIGASVKTLVLSTAKNLNTNTTVPSTIHLVIKQGGSIISNGFALIINGPLSAGLYPIFSGFSSGAVTFGAGAVNRTHAVWGAGLVDREYDYPTGNVAIGTNTLKLFVRRCTAADVPALCPEEHAETYNIAIGVSAMSKLAVGSWNMAIGNYTLQNMTSGNNNVAIGESAMSNNTTGSSNTAIGIYALNDNTTANANTAVGSAAALHNTTGQNLTAIGSTAALSNTTGNNNTAVGNDSLYSNTVGSGNIAIGKSALYTSTSVIGRNIGIGYLALDLLTTGSKNVGIGYNVMPYALTGDNNTAIGDTAGWNGTNLPGVSQCTFIGASAAASVNNISNTTVVGYNATADASNQVVLGNTSVTNFKFGPYTAFQPWVTPVFNAGDFSATGAMTWTVEAGDVVTYAYTLVGKTMTVSFVISNSSVGGTPSGYLRIIIPAGKTAAKSMQNPIITKDNGVSSFGAVNVNAGETYIYITKDIPVTNWSASTNNTTVVGQLTFEIQ